MVLHWALNDWQLPPEEVRPAGTVQVKCSVPGVVWLQSVQWASIMISWPWRAAQCHPPKLKEQRSLLARDPCNSQAVRSCCESGFMLSSFDDARPQMDDKAVQTPFKGGASVHLSFPQVHILWDPTAGSTCTPCRRSNCEVLQC